MKSLIDRLKQIGANSLADGLKKLGEELEQLTNDVAKELERDTERPPPQHVDIKVTEKRN